jgi:hypothetical protein
MAGVDRVRERRRAAALACHYRDQENLPIAEIARRLGRAKATVKAYLYDPTHDKELAGERVAGQLRRPALRVTTPTSSSGAIDDPCRSVADPTAPRIHCFA